MSNLQRHKDCAMRSETGNCLAIGGFCTSVSKEICEGLQNAYTNGKHNCGASTNRPQGWVDKAISIIDDMQREGIIDYEQAWEFRMRARTKGADDE